MFLDVLFERLDQAGEADALIWRNQAYSFAWLRARIDHWLQRLEIEGVAAGSVAALEADFSPNAVALFLALIERGCILVPLTSSVAAKKEEYLDVAQVECVGSIDDGDEVSFERTGRSADHELYAEVRRRSHPGLGARKNLCLDGHGCTACESDVACLPTRAPLVYCFFVALEPIFEEFPKFLVTGVLYIIRLVAASRVHYQHFIRGFLFRSVIQRGTDGCVGPGKGPQGRRAVAELRQRARA